MNELEQLQQAIDALEAQRAVLGDAVVDASVSALRQKLTLQFPKSELERQRKQVTILFADIVDSTRICRYLDPETVFEIMDGALRAFGHVVTDHEGIVARLMGDGLLAFFGAPKAREDDPQRAIRAGLDIVTFAKAYALEATRRWGIEPLTVRVGIHTGPAALGEIGGASGSEYTAMGDVTNMAARLQIAAPVQGVLISHDTYRLVSGLFDTEEQEPFFVKGKDEALTTYIVRGAKQRAFHPGTRGVAGIATAMVGRDTEFVGLQQAVQSWLRQRRMQSFVITGDAGVGKSRLLFELERWLAQLPQHISLLKGRSSLDMQGSSNGLIRDIAAHRFKIQDSDPPEVVRHKLSSGLAPGQETDQLAQMQVHVVGQWLGFDFGSSTYLKGLLDDARQLHDRALMYLVDFLKIIASLNPSILLLEDLHWADDSSLDALDGILPELSEQPVFVIATTRPGLYRRRPNYGQQWPAYRHIKLDSINEEDCRALVRDILQRVDHVPDALSKLIVDRADGNPFYIEELIKMLMEDGVIVKGAKRWHVESLDLVRVRIPTTLTGVLQARLDRLSSQERKVLQQAAVIGRRFWDDAICYLELDALPEDRRTDVNRSLSSMQEREIVFGRNHSTITEAHEYIFKHATLRDVAYESVLHKLRRTYHGLTADWLIKIVGDRLTEFAAIIAEHLELAKRCEEALEYWRRAGDQAAAQYANGEAVMSYSRALSLLAPHDQKTRYDLLRARELIYDLLGEHQPQARDLQTMREIAEALDDTHRQGEVALREAHLAWSLVDHEQTLAATKRAIKLAQLSNDPDTEGGAHLYWARVLLRQGQYDEAQRHAQDALEKGRIANHLQLQADCLRALGVIAYFQGQYKQAREYWEQTLILCRDETLLDRRGEANTLNNLGGMLADQGDLLSAIDYGERALQVSREIGNLDGICSALGNLGSFALDQGNYAAAIHYLQESIEKSRVVGERYYEANGLTNLGSAYMHLGLAHQAQESFQAAVILYQEIEDQRGQSNLLNLLGLMQLWTGNPQSAYESLQQALAIGIKIGSLNSQAQTLTFLGHVFLHLEQPDEALKAGRRASELLLDLDELHLVPDALAVQASALDAAGQLQQAQLLVQEIIERLANVPPERGIALCQIHLTCYLVLQKVQAAEALDHLNLAHRRMQELAGHIENDSQRNSFLTNIPTNRQIRLEFERAQTVNKPGSSGE